MAKKLQNPKVGDYVYKPFAPSMAGKIIGCVKLAGAFPGDCSVTVKWLNGTVTTETSWHLQDFNGLIAEHQKRLATHTKTLERLEKL